MIQIFPTYGSVTVVERPRQKNIVGAWKFSRPNDKVSLPYDKVASIDVPVNEMSDFIIQCNMPILIRELLFSLRDHVAWARTSRVDDLTKWGIYYSSYEARPFQLDQLASEMHSMMEGDQDNFRMKLPLSYMTKWTMKMTPRTVVKVASSFRQMSKMGSPSAAIRELFGHVANEFMRALEGTPYREIALKDGFGIIDFVNWDKVPKLSHYAQHVVLGGMVVVALPAVPIALRAQLVRHRTISLRDNMRDYLTDDGFASPIDSPINVEVAMTIETAQSLVSKRNCWISQVDLWRPFLTEVNKALGRFRNLNLPCTGKSECPIARDNELRMAGKDPAPPCPIYSRLHNQKMSPEQRGDAYRFATRRPDELFWLNEIDITS